ncbi:hypothetical protein [Ligilactobacillus salivarius]|uniref:hypothetical protein n=1 Tax=Ligilactobacillus salivarius TaxID=1624 RepID=UPI00136C9F8F|nr:hypothetical protein [Ligilactobacillus salivarius]MYY75925.1 hypothetical protein [Ligilactobacillus salivarius]MYZ03899.1 hypothetical protein [Ligilactobacillus salivarius]MYZ71805.1 hypothetical protein [Ligilactobacillus salivarius]MYZ77336.1 hypothetical protein [Ligilactobacillus salivarius]
MKINFKNENETKEMYQVGNVIKAENGSLYLVAVGIDGGYMLVDLSGNVVLEMYETLEDLRLSEEEPTDLLTNVEINEI